MLYKAFGIRFDVMVFGQVGFPPPPSFFSLICLYVGDSQILDLVSLILNYKLIGASEYALGLCETTQCETTNTYLSMRSLHRGTQFSVGYHFGCNNEGECDKQIK